MSKKDRETAKKIAQTLKGMDKLVFPENPSEVNIHYGPPIIRKTKTTRVRGKKTFLCYQCSRHKDPNKRVEYFDLYISGLYRWVQKNAAKDTHIILIGANLELAKNKTREEKMALREKFIPLEKTLFFTEEEFIIGISAHEQRHKYQTSGATKLFSKKNIKKIPALKILCRNAIPSLERRIAKKDLKREIDAMIVQRVTAAMWRQGRRKPQDLVRAITASPESFGGQEPLISPLFLL